MNLKCPTLKIKMSDSKIKNYYGVVKKNHNGNVLLLYLFVSISSNRFFNEICSITRPEQS